ncbi:MAG: di-trans,poly-cis-decaprenylcistransferase [Planctomycetes bacterium]|nr:di-trans,poly-cis-decaprenylcistransferase [Planctomycetota bacterium]
MSDTSPADREREAQARRLVPRSVAMIMDGNGRWAQQRGLPRVAGHRAGAIAVDRVTEAAARLGIESLTLYAFSTENWQRPAHEVETLWKLLVRDLKRRGPKLLKQGIRLTTIGRRDRMPAAAVSEIDRVQRETAGGTKMQLCLALDYGGWWDLTEMAERVRRGERDGTLPPGPLTPESLERLLPSAIVPPVDLLIRTGGEARISNYLPWQLAYAELVFLPVLWPDFDDDGLTTACREFSHRRRRFGRVDEQAEAELRTPEPLVAAIEPAPRRRGLAALLRSKR